MIAPSAAHSAVAAGQEGAANDDGDDGFEFLEQSAICRG